MLKQLKIKVRIASFMYTYRKSRSFFPPVDFTKEDIYKPRNFNISSVDNVQMRMGRRSEGGEFDVWGAEE